MANGLDLGLYTILLPFILMGIVGPIVTFLMMRHVQNQDKTASKSTLATFNIGSMKDDFKEFKDSYDKKETELKAEMRRIWERLDIVTTSVKLAEYRLDRLDKLSNAGS